MCGATKTKVAPLDNKRRAIKKAALPLVVVVVSVVVAVFVAAAVAYIVDASLPPALPACLLSLSASLLLSFHAHTHTFSHTQIALICQRRHLSRTLSVCVVVVVGAALSSPSLLASLPPFCSCAHDE